MIDKQEFIDRFIKRTSERPNSFFNACRSYYFTLAEESWKEYKDDPDAMTPEEWANEQGYSTEQATKGDVE